MTREIEPAAQAGLAGTDSWVPVLASVGSLAGKLAATSFVPKSMRRQPESVAAAILTGREMGLGPMASLRGIDVIEGRPALTGQMLAARVLSAGHTIEWLESTDTRCTVRIARGDGLSAAEVSWTQADAQRAGLWGKGAWRGYPRHMLRHRALSEAAAMACPDVALGLDVAVAPEEGGRASSGPVRVAVAAPAPVPEPDDPAPVPEGVRVIEAAPDPDPDHPEPEERQEQLVSDRQMRMLGHLIGQVEERQGERLDRAQRRQLIARMAGHPDPGTLATAKDLTAGQASTAIDALQAHLDEEPDQDGGDS